MHRLVSIQTGALSKKSHTDILKTLRELYADRSYIDRAIGILAVLADGKGKRARPHKGATQAQTQQPAGKMSRKARAAAPQGKSRGARKSQ
jgi:hypothetical protein